MFLYTGNTILKASLSNEYKAMYQKTNSVLIINSLGDTGKVILFTDEDHWTAGKNFDSCGHGISFTESGKGIVFVTDKSNFLQQRQDYDPLVIVHYDPDIGIDLLTKLEVNRKIDHELETCILGTNSISNGKLYYKDVTSYDRHSQILAYDFVTKNSEVVFDFNHTIIAPAISPDGKLLGFTAEDGIYVYSFETGTITKLIDLQWSKGLIEEGYDYRKHNHAYISRYVPIISWSPDSSKFIFHLVDFSGDSEAFSIYLYDLDTSEYSLFIEDGYYPYWIID
jgi:hypothetical protein